MKCFAVGLALSAGSVVLQAGWKPEKIYRTILPAVATLEVENNQGDWFMGSAVLALGDDVVLTAWHVVWDAREVWATFANGEVVKVLGCIDKDGARDLAALKLERKFPRLKAAVCTPLQPVASRVYVIGAPKGFPFSISDGLISQIRRVDGISQYQVSCPISTGNSGGPVLNERAEVIGIISWTKADAQNVSFAIPAGALAALNVSRPFVAWEDLAITNRPALARHSVEPPRRALPVRQENPEAETLEKLKEALHGANGKTVTVTVREPGQEKKFTFTIPAGGLK